MRSFNRAYPLKVDLDASSTAKEGSECDEEEVRGEEEVVKDATLDLASARASVNVSGMKFGASLSMGPWT